MNLSKNGVGLIIMVMSLFGVNVAGSDMMTTISVIGQVVSVILMAYNQYARPNVDKFIFKKEE